MKRMFSLRTSWSYAAIAALLAVGFLGHAQLGDREQPRSVAIGIDRVITPSDTSWGG